MTASPRTPWACIHPGGHAAGDTQATAERHGRDARHATTTATTPDGAARIAGHAQGRTP